ncbi:MAG: hypothetical protein AAFV53_09785 [Myxococcota bacterium]
MRQILILTALMTGCADPTELNISGFVRPAEGGDDIPLNPLRGYWGGPFIAFTGDDLECEEVDWINKFNEDGDDALVDYDVNVLQFTFSESDVTAGSYALSGASPIIAEFLSIEDGKQAVYTATEGTLDLEDFEDENPLTGEFDFFIGDEGGFRGTFTVPHCPNLSSRF